MNKSALLAREGVLNCQLSITAITVLLHVKRSHIKEDVGIIPPLLCSENIAIEVALDVSEKGTTSEQQKSLLYGTLVQSYPRITQFSTYDHATILMYTRDHV